MMGCHTCLKNKITLEEALEQCRECPIVKKITINDNNTVVFVLQCGKNKNLCSTVWQLGNGCPNSLWGILDKPLK
jgi:hypothetical protein